MILNSEPHVLNDARAGEICVCVSFRKFRDRLGARCMGEVSRLGDIRTMQSKQKLMTSSRGEVTCDLSHTSEQNNTTHLVSVQ